MKLLVIKLSFDLFRDSNVWSDAALAVIMIIIDKTKDEQQPSQLSIKLPVQHIEHLVEPLGAHPFLPPFLLVHFPSLDLVDLE